MNEMITVKIARSELPQIRSVEFNRDRILFIEHRSDNTVRICFSENVSFILSEYDWENRNK